MDARQHLVNAPETGETVAPSQVKPRTSPTLKAALMGILMATSASAVAACSKPPVIIKPEPTETEKAKKAQEEACEDGFGQVANGSNTRPFAKILDGEEETTIIDACANNGKGKTLVADALCEDFTTAKNGVQCTEVNGNQDWTVTVGGRHYIIFGDENPSAVAKNGKFKRDEHKTWEKGTGLDQYCSAGVCEKANDLTKLALGHNVKECEKAEVKPKPPRPTPVPIATQKTPEPPCDPCRNDKLVADLAATVGRHDAELKDHEERITVVERKVELTADQVSEIVARGHAKKRAEGQQ